MAKLGQHFLKSEKIINQIVEAAEIKKDDVVLEIGPGRGILTEALLKNAGTVIAIEKDKDLFDFLQSKFRDAKNFELINDDILKINVSRFKIQDLRFKIVANIPYYITGAILRKFLSSENQPSLMVLMVQKEVAQRIVAKPPQMSMLSLSVRAYGRPKIAGHVPKGHFSPPPKVDSAIIKIENISKDFFIKNKINEEKFFGFVSRGFSHKRKMLKNNLGISEDEIKKTGLSEKARAQELNLEDWEKLYHTIISAEN